MDIFIFFYSYFLVLLVFCFGFRFSSGSTSSFSFFLSLRNLFSVSFLPSFILISFLYFIFKFTFHLIVQLCKCRQQKKPISEVEWVQGREWKSQAKSFRFFKLSWHTTMMGSMGILKQGPPLHGWEGERERRNNKQCQGLYFFAKWPVAEFNERQNIFNDPRKSRHKTDEKGGREAKS